MDGRRQRRRGAGVLVTALFALAATIPASASAAATWRPPVDLGAATENILTAFGLRDIAVAADGTVAAIWTQGVDPTCCPTVIQVSVRPPGGSFSAPQTLSAPGQVASSPAIDVNANGDFIAVWIENNGANNIIRGALRPAGGSFAAAQDLSGTGQNASSPDVAWSGNAAIAVWARSNATNNIVQNAIKQAGSNFFGSANDLSATGQNANVPTIETNANGDAIVGWQRSNASNQAVVQAAFRAAGGSFVNLADLYTNTSSGHIDGPQAAIAPDGRTTMAWADADGSSSIHTIYAMSRGLSGQFAGLDPVSEPGVDSGSAGYFDLAVDANDTAVAVWNAVEVRTSTRPSGGAFSNSIQTVSQPGLFVGSPAVGFTLDNRAIAVWQGGSGSNAAIQSSEMPAGGTFGAVKNIEVGAAGDGLFGPTPFEVDNEGNIATLWGRQFDSDPSLATAVRYQMRAAGYDGAPPTLVSVSVPGTGTAGTAAAMSASATDRWSGVTVAWSFGDGASGSGASVTHAYAAPGTYTVNVTATDGIGNTATATKTIAVNAAAAIPPGGESADCKKAREKLKKAKEKLKKLKQDDAKPAAIETAKEKVKKAKEKVKKACK